MLSAFEISSEFGNFFEFLISLDMLQLFFHFQILYLIF